MTQINRRALLGAMPAVAVYPAAALAMVAPERGPIERMLYQWKAFRVAYNECDDEEAGQPLFDRHCEIGEAIAASVPATVRELYCKIIAADDRGDLGTTPAAAALVGEAMAAIGWSWEADSDGPEAVPMVPAPAAQSPVEQAYWRWRADYRLINGPAFKGMPYHQFDAIAADNWGLCLDVLKQPCTSPRDFMLKILAFTADGEDFADTEDRAGCRIVQEGLDMIGGVA